MYTPIVLLACNNDGFVACGYLRPYDITVELEYGSAQRWVPALTPPPMLEEGHTQPLSALNTERATIFCVVINTVAPRISTVYRHAYKVHVISKCVQIIYVHFGDTEIIDILSKYFLRFPYA